MALAFDFVYKYMMVWDFKQSQTTFSSRQQFQTTSNYMKQSQTILNLYITKIFLIFALDFIIVTWI